ncbi:EI24 domain-containing protein [Uliginosibacterium gangwonense]|uniref:EI24 domain-containing protein n=1 Tax=Uliginosibacterium gangwonense TaxID=392736 RepID=UPI000363934C|nr:EI24 domain-containing protein [Uliginosibacterium gangwonense]
MIKDISGAYLKAFRSLFSRDVFVHMLWPAGVSLVVWVLGLCFAWGPVSDGLQGWLASWPVLGVWLNNAWVSVATGVLLKLLLLMLLIYFAYVLAVLIFAVFAMPMMVECVAKTDYSGLERRAGGSLWGSAANAGVSVFLFGFLCVLGLPMLFVPVVNVVVVVVLAAWFNARCFSYDALMSHADAQELRQIPLARRGTLFVVGTVGGLLGLVPVVNLLAPALSGLAFTHYLLQALQRERQQGAG